MAREWWIAAAGCGVGLGMGAAVWDYGVDGWLAGIAGGLGLLVIEGVAKRRRRADG